MATHHYDVVVHGDETAGLVAAALLGRRGLRVLLVGLDRRPPTFAAGTRELPTEPGLLPPVDSPAVARVFAELNSVPLLRRRAPVLRPALQFVLPEGRLDVGADTPALFKQVRQMYPGSHASIEAGLARLSAVGSILDPLLGSDVALPASGFWERRELARTESLLPPGDTDLLAPLPHDHPVRAALVALAALTTRLGPMDLGPVALARAWELSRRGYHRIEGDLAGLRQLFLERIESTSGEVRPQGAISEVISKRGRVVALRLSPRDEEVGVGQLVWAAPAATLLPHASDASGRALRESTSALRPTAYRYRLCLAVRQGGVPVGFGPRVVALREPGRPPLEDNALAITVGELDPGAKLQYLWVECLVPAQAVDAERNYLRIVRKRVHEHLRALLPRLDTDLLVMASPHDGLPPEVPWEPVESAPGLTGAPAAESRPMTTSLSPDLPRLLGVGAAPRDTGVPNVLLASGEVLPGLGAEGDFASGWSVARVIRASAVRRSPRRSVIVGES